MNKEAYAEGYQFGVKMALNSCGVVKTAAMPAILTKALEAASGLPSWAKGMGAGAAAGGGLGAIGGDGLEDILGGALGGAAIGGVARGGGKALSEAAQAPGAKLLEQLGLGSVGKAKGLASKAKGEAGAAAGRVGQGAEMKVPSSIMDSLRSDMMGAGGAAAKAQGAVPQAAANQASAGLSPEILSALGLAGGGAGLGGALG